MMEANKPWVALLDEDEDDYVFWQHGFQSWASHLELQWFTSVPAFLSATSLGKSRPVALVMDGVVPRGEETKWLSTILLHPSCEQACMIMLSSQVNDQEREAYMRLGATDHLIKPINLDQLQSVVSTVSDHVAAKAKL
ncbi:response regulator [Spirosoma flavum]|uniref:Response regulator n=1 Tax=Spirosoma flavum TaxID=2048557 RepID=A0ABW6ASV4_9BACT